MSVLSDFLHSIGSAFGLGTPGGQGGTAYVPTGQSNVDQALQGLFSGLSSDIGTASNVLMPALLQAFQATQPGGQFGGLPGQLQGYQGTLANQAQGAYGAMAPLQQAGQQVYNTALDPQQALYNRLYQQTQDASRAGTSARGIGMSPEASGIENQALSNFNIDWQNQQLARQLAGLQGLTSGYGAAGQYGQLGNADLAGAAQMGQTGAQLPFNFANAYGQGMNTAYGPLQTLGNELANYLGLGQGASSLASSQGQNALGNVSQGMQWLAPLFSSGAGAAGAGAAASATPGLDASLFFMP
jgi:hypothetical protein